MALLISYVKTNPFQTERGRQVCIGSKRSRGAIPNSRVRRGQIGNERGVDDPEEIGKPGCGIAKGLLILSRGRALLAESHRVPQRCLKHGAVGLAKPRRDGGKRRIYMGPK